MNVSSRVMCGIITLAKTHEYRAILLTAPSARPTCVLADFHGQVASGACFIGEKSAMLRCQVCQKHRFYINEDGLCDQCKGEAEKNSKTLRVEFETPKKAVPYLPNKTILSKTAWLRMRAAVDAYYNSVSIEDVDAYNARVKSQIIATGANPQMGHIYLLSSSVGYYKIGKAIDVEFRLRQHLRDYPIRIEIVHTISCPNMSQAESFLLSTFSDQRVQGEWFSLTADDVAWVKSIDEAELSKLVKQWAIARNKP